MRDWKALCACLLISACSERPTNWTLSSPDRSVELTVGLASATDVSGHATLGYAIQQQGKAVVSASPLGLQTSIGEFGPGLRFVSSEQRTVSETYHATTGKRRVRKVSGEELTLRLANPAGEEIELVLRAHNDGVAFRYRVLGEGPITVVGEDSSFAFDREGAAYLANYDLLGEFFAGTYEQPYKRVAVGTEPQTSASWAYPALFSLNDDVWALVTEADNDGTGCGTRLSVDAEGRYVVAFPKAGDGNGVGAANPTTQLPYTSAWRVVMVGGLKAIVESTLVDDLSRQSAFADTDWIAPGRAVWSWYSQGTGTPELQREYIATAHDMGFEYLLIDEGWDRWEDAETVMPALISDAAAAGVRVLLWYNSGGNHTKNLGTPMNRMEDPAMRADEMDRLASWGAAGVKVDFFESDKQDRFQQYVGILSDAADRQLLVNFHGATIPRGWQRTYPNLMAHEAVRGSEYFKYAPATPPGADLNVLFAFTRNVIGSMDYTPGALADALSAQALPYAHSLALAVLFESGLQHFADRADSDPNAGYAALFSRYPFVRTLLAQMPVTWDETRFLSGAPESHVALARRHGDRWYVTGIAGSTVDVQLLLPLDFLDRASYTMQLITRSDAPDSLEEHERVVGKDDSLSIDLRARDGFIALLSPRS